MDQKNERSRSREKHKKVKKEKKEKKEKKHSKMKEQEKSDYKTNNQHGRNQLGTGKKEQLSENWNLDKIEQGTKEQEIGKQILDMIKNEREQDEQKYKEWMVRKGYSEVKVKAPLNIYEELMKKNIQKPHQDVNPSTLNNPLNPTMIEVIVNDRLGKKERIKCCPQDKVGEFKKLISAKTGTRPDKIRLQRQHMILKDHISLEDYEIKHEMALEMYYN